MTYYGPPPPKHRGGTLLWLGIKPNAQDHKAVHAWSVMGLTTNDMLKRLKERFKLSKLPSKQTLYHHFRKDIIPRSRGRRPTIAALRKNVADNIASEMRKMIGEIRKRR